MTNDQIVALIRNATIPLDTWIDRIRFGYKGAPYNVQATNYYKALAAARQVGPTPPPPPPPPSSQIDPWLQNASVGAWGPWDARRWPKSVIYLSADPAESLSRFVSRAEADSARADGHKVAVWYVPDQVDHSRAVQVADTLGCDPVHIMADCETLGRWQIAFHSGVTKGIANLSALWEDPEANEAIRTGKFKVMNEFYNNQDRSRKPDNHNLPVSSLCVAVYDGCSDSTGTDCWEPHIKDYIAMGYYWPTMSVYQQNMRTEDWDLMPRIA